MAITLKEGVEILNDSLKRIGYDYQIDVTNNETMTAGLQGVGITDPEQMNAVIKQMNLIVQFRNFGTIYEANDNQLRAFIIEKLEQGFGIEDIYHELIEGYEPLWDKKADGTAIAKNLFDYDTNKIHKTFHVSKREKQFKTTVDMRNYDKLFTSYGVTNFVDVKLGNLSFSAEAWLMKEIYNIIKEMCDNRMVVYINDIDINSNQGIRNAVEKIKSTSDGMCTLNALYNVGAYDVDTASYVSLETISRKNDLYLVTTPEHFNRLKVQGYANAYNLAQFEIDNRIIYIPAGYSLGENPDGQEILFLLCDRRTIVCAINFWRGSNEYISNVFQSNNFLTVEILRGYNTYFNTVAFCGEGMIPVEDFDGEKKNNPLVYLRVEGMGIEDLYGTLEFDGVLLTSANFNDYFELMFTPYQASGDTYVSKKSIKHIKSVTSVFAEFAASVSTGVINKPIAVWDSDYFNMNIYETTLISILR